MELADESEEDRKKRLWEEAKRKDIPPLRDWEDFDEEKYLRWLGGFFDGEGCVSIPEMKKLTGYPYDYTLAVVVKGNFKEALEEIQHRFEGNFTLQKIRNILGDSAGPRIRHCVFWKLSSLMLDSNGKK